MSAPTLTEIKVERIDEEESPCIDLMFPPYHPESQDVNCYEENKFHVLKNLKKDFSEDCNHESVGCGFTNETTFESPVNSTETEEHVNCYDNKFDVSKQPKREFIEVETLESSYNSTNEVSSECTTNHSDSKEHVNSYDNKFHAMTQLKKELSEEQSAESSCTLANKKNSEDNKTVEPVGVKQEIPCEYNEYEELFLSVKVKKGDRKYQGKRKTDGVNNQQGNTSVHYDVLISNKEVPCKFCDKKFKNSFNLFKHNIEHLKLEINTPDIIRTYHNKAKSHNRRLEKRSYKKQGEHKTKILYHCKLCNKHYKYRSWYKHQETVHSEKKYKCGLCGKKFGCFVYVENHMKIVHVVKMYQEKFEQGRMFSCWCGKEFRSQTNLNIHKKERHNMIGQNYTPINVGFL